MVVSGGPTFTLKFTIFTTYYVKDCMHFFKREFVKTSIYSYFILLNTQKIHVVIESLLFIILLFHFQIGNLIQAMLVL